MTKNIILLQTLALAVMICSGCATSGGRNLRVAEKVLNAGDEPQLSNISAIGSGFCRADFSREVLAKYPEASLNRVFAALNKMVFLLPGNPQYISWQRDILDEKVRRGEYNAQELRHMFLSYVSARMFDKAAALKIEFASATLPDIPEKFIDNVPKTSSWRAYAVSDGGKTVEMKALPLDTGNKIVMAMFTGCHLAEKAMEEIMTDPAFSAAFRVHGILLTDKFDSQGIAMWKEHFNFPDIYIVDRAGDFSMFDFRSSPGFYFLKDGKVVSKFVGWDNTSRMELQKGLDQAAASAI